MCGRECFERSGSWVVFVALFSTLFAGIVTPFSLLAREDDAYLKALSEEANKVGRTRPVEGEGSSGLGKDRQIEARQAFESELKERYAGSAVFYGKLSAPVQEEIFQEYQAGASIRDLRKKIMDRFLQR